jgi:hypothetical protein
VVNDSHLIHYCEYVPLELTDIAPIHAALDGVSFAVSCIFVAEPAIGCVNSFFMGHVIESFLDRVL